MSGARLFHLHIPKTAGTALRSAFGRAEHKILPVGSNFVFDPARHGDVDLFSGHAGFRAVEASPALRGKVITILRDPYDRLMSYYYHLVQQHRDGLENSHRSLLASKYNLAEFLAIKDDPHLLSDIYNTMTWQLVYDISVNARMEYRSRMPAFSEADLVERAKANLSSFLVVGFQSQMGPFLSKLKEMSGFSGRLVTENATAERVALHAIDADTRRRLRGWIELDLEVYEWALANLGRD
ncbi:MAG: sulfotransferase family 2 domain-containing protein [Pseudomonadota bacterium]|nr:sulfotransferase family 2 domain-containing protein [Pseudomonadota bacterium]